MISTKQAVLFLFTLFVTLSFCRYTVQKSSSFLQCGNYTTIIYTRQPTTCSPRVFFGGFTYSDCIPGNGTWTYVCEDSECTNCTLTITPYTSCNFGSESSCVDELPATTTGWLYSDSYQWTTECNTNISFRIEYPTSTACLTTYQFTCDGDALAVVPCNGSTQCGVCDTTSTIPWNAECNNFYFAPTEAPNGTVTPQPVVPSIPASLVYHCGTFVPPTPTDAPPSDAPTDVVLPSEIPTESTMPSEIPTETGSPSGEPQTGTPASLSPSSSGVPTNTAGPVAPTNTGGPASPAPSVPITTAPTAASSKLVVGLSFLFAFIALFF